MADPRLKELRDAERKREITEFTTIVSSYLAIPLFPLFWIADLMYVPHLKWEFLTVRCGMIPIALFTNRLIKRAHTLTQVQLIGVAFAFINAAVITLLIYWAEGATSPYYAGLNLVVLAYALFPYTTKYGLLIFLLIFGPFFAIAPFNITETSEWLTLGVHSFFMSSTLLIAIVIRMVLESTKLKELKAQLDLKDELDSREETIRIKTKEGLRLTQLSKQFSPQIIHTIRGGDINFEDKGVKTPICVIFLDIVGSTERINSIRIEEFTRAINVFTEESMKLLLKHDITIDKFLGDGILGFTNAPIPRKDYINRCVEAGLEIHARFEDLQILLNDIWNSEFQLKIGIASGEAIVGFFGSKDSHKSYTAIGTPINLAARLCNVAEPNQVLVGEGVQKALASEPLQFHRISGKELKGFEEGTSLYEVSRREDLKSEFSGDVDYCPEGHGVLHLDTNEEGIYVFRCRTCNYVLNENEDDKEEDLKKAA